ncbi:hypothetical protein OGAPHI_002179 [Ogataea philodendri]|uniref:Uncharacterized protein n=1 Tax=Ogataea philodendri TaxID=1378263 RepID=A0A9P8PBB5_9ASCO|nr:uncharacterized protein OGAPHI_002179 [Ogataea philodendri]KAH3668425.1 hypothetical protein OGAPHI_002179 [Ogataea philodendri]
MYGLALRSVIKHQVSGSSGLLRPSVLIPVRHFHTTLANHRFRCRPSRRIVRPSLANEIWTKSPNPLKVALGLTAIGSLVLFVALPLFVVVVPPLFIGTFFAYRLARWRNRKQMEEKWSLLHNSRLVFRPRTTVDPLLMPPIDQINSDLANFELRRISNAFLLNENDIANYFGIEDVNDIALGALEGIQYEGRVATKNIHGSLRQVDELITVQSRPLYDKRSREKIAQVIVSLKNLDPPVYESYIDQPSGAVKSRCVIEIVPLGITASKRFIIDTPSIEEDVIDVEGRTRIL